jgi:hypothetical protein
MAVVAADAAEVGTKNKRAASALSEAPLAVDSSVCVLLPKFVSFSP